MASDKVKMECVDGCTIKDKKITIKKGNDATIKGIISKTGFVTFDLRYEGSDKKFISLNGVAIRVVPDKPFLDTETTKASYEDNADNYSVQFKIKKDAPSEFKLKYTLGLKEGKDETGEFMIQTAEGSTGGRTGGGIAGIVTGIIMVLFCYYLQE